MSIFLTGIAITATLSGCNNPKAANKENFAKILSENIVNNPNYTPKGMPCVIWLSALSQPLPAPSEGLSLDSGFRVYAELAKAKILTSQIVGEQDEHWGFSSLIKKRKIAKYDLSEKGKQMAKQDEKGNFYLPYCRAIFKEVKFFTEPVQNQTMVTATYDLKVDDWILDPAMNDVTKFAGIGDLTSYTQAPNEYRTYFYLTSEGWKIAK
jgi:hypothetical protein